MVRVGFEPTPGFPDEKTCLAGKLSLESHALDRSAIAPLKPNVPPRFNTSNMPLALPTCLNVSNGFLSGACIFAIRLFFQVFFQLVDMYTCIETLRTSLTIF